MKIGFDLDNIFIDTPPIIPKSIIERLYKKKTKDTLLYRIPSRTEQYIRLFSHLPFLRPAIEQNIEILKSMQKNNSNYYLISSRYGFLKKATDGLIKKHNLDQFFDDLHFNYKNEQPHLFKQKLISDLKLDKYIDDDLHLLKFIANNNNKTKLYWFNKKINKKIGDRITAIINLQDIFRD